MHTSAQVDTYVFLPPADLRNQLSIPSSLNYPGGSIFPAVLHHRNLPPPQRTMGQA